MRMASARNESRATQRAHILQVQIDARGAEIPLPKILGARRSTTAEFLNCGAWDSKLPVGQKQSRASGIHGSGSYRGRPNSKTKPPARQHFLPRDPVCYSATSRRPVTAIQRRGLSKNVEPSLV